MPFKHSSANYRATAKALIEHIRKNLTTTTGRKQWSEGNFDVLRNFTIPNEKMTYFPTPNQHKPSGMTGQFLWDFMACGSEDVILLAESEWLSKQDELEHDFEKLLYTRCPIKLLMCGRWDRDGKKIAEELRDYAKKCSKNYGPGEVFILYCLGWLNSEGDKRNDQVFWWQVPGEVCLNDGTDFEFDEIP